MEQKYSYIVFLYCDYRKEVDIQHLKVFADRDKAIEFAKKYSNPKVTKREYVSIAGTEYDANFIGDDNDSYLEGETEEEGHIRIQNEREIHEKALSELKVKQSMWYIRIAVDKVEMN